MEGVMVPPGDEERLGSREQAMAILHEELNTPVSARRILEKAGRLANCDVRDVRLITDEGSRLGAEDAFCWGGDGMASVVFEQIGGGGKKRSRDVEPPLSPSVVLNKAAAANSPLRAAITLGFDTKGRNAFRNAAGCNAFRNAAALCDVDLNAPGEPFKEMVPYVAAFKDGLTGEPGLAKKAQDTIYMLRWSPQNGLKVRAPPARFPPPHTLLLLFERAPTLCSIQDTFAKDSSAAGTDEWETVCPFWRNHVQVILTLTLT